MIEETICDGLPSDTMTASLQLGLPEGCLISGCNAPKHGVDSGKIVGLLEAKSVGHKSIKHSTLVDRPRIINTNSIAPVLTRNKSIETDILNMCLKVSDKKSVGSVDPANGPGVLDFPSTPLNNDLACDIAHSFCSNPSPKVMEEADCTVCGLLTPISQLTRLKAIKNLLHILHAPGVTRVERKNASMKVREFNGPVLDYRCNQICDSCRKQIRKGKVPVNALAKGIWLGVVPKELANLNFVERFLVARVRVNGCFV